MASLGEMLDNILGYLFQPVIPGNEVILPGELPLQLLLLLLVKLSLFQNAVHPLLEGLLVFQLKLRDTVFVVEWYRGTVFH